jgi:hypothetical protein
MRLATHTRARLSLSPPYEYMALQIVCRVRAKAPFACYFIAEKKDREIPCPKADVKILRQDCHLHWRKLLVRAIRLSR